MNDLASRADIAVVVDAFYAKAIQDEQIGYLFEGLDLMNHLPVIHDFWENILWRTGAYKGGMMYKHLLLNARKPLTLEHFERWLELFTQTVDAHYKGPNASTMKQLAHSIARTIYARVSQQSSVPMGVQDAPSETSAGAG
ncbi:group III truncated hemoglobin [Meiothermus cerbereus]|uniref:group III truncated hemoglobin n=1 Tax=Meiothermus cerbereus TaxID=65552 RepID=UPI00048402A9|nr:group III truncated hemoglobin [Meiothermus cerbereus]